MGCSSYLKDTGSGVDWWGHFADFFWLDMESALPCVLLELFRC